MRLHAKATQRIFATTMGAATALECEDLRRLFLNAKVVAPPDGGSHA
ncbi:MAG: hypothetical protein P1V81_12605 [Planctomycetota bacterium]|nr:hypothetical protein [Planctomycetota bacterium]